MTPMLTGMRWFVRMLVAGLAVPCAPTAPVWIDAPASGLPAFFDPDANPDGDSLTTDEERRYGTNPLDPDTDRDGVRE